METYANDTGSSDQLDELIRDRALGVALSIGLEVAQVTNVTVAIGWRAMLLVFRVDYAHAL